MVAWVSKEWVWPSRRDNIGKDRWETLGTWDVSSSRKEREVGTESSHWREDTTNTSHCTNSWTVMEWSV